MGNDQRFDGSSSSCSSKKNKSPSNNNNNNSNNSEKPKQPQRGLGVAQLEKIRLHSQMANNCGYIPQLHFPAFPNPNFPASFQEDMRIQAAYHQAALQNLQASSTPFGYGPPPGYPHPNNLMMGFGEHMERPGGIRFGESQQAMTPRWNPNNNIAVMSENPQYMQPQGLITRHLLSHVEQNNRRDSSSEQKGSSSRNPEPRTENEELDLELKL